MWEIDGGVRSGQIRSDSLKIHSPVSTPSVDGREGNPAQCASPLAQGLFPWALMARACVRRRWSRSICRCGDRTGGWLGIARAFRPLIGILSGIATPIARSRHRCLSVLISDTQCAKAPPEMTRCSPRAFWRSGVGSHVNPLTVSHAVSTRVRA